MNKEYNAYASRALLRAEEDAKSCRQKYVGTEHLVLGLLSEEESLAGRVLTENGVTYQTFFDAVLGQSAALGDNEKTSFIGYWERAVRRRSVFTRKRSARSTSCWRF